MNRRSFIIHSTAASFALILPIGIVQFANEEVWVPPDLTSLKPGDQIDLSQTLPKTIQRGGVFSVQGRLPLGVSLSQAGVLSVGLEAELGRVSQVSFTYIEPSFRI